LHTYKYAKSVLFFDSDNMVTLDEWPKVCVLLMTEKTTRFDILRWNPWDNFRYFCV